MARKFEGNFEIGGKNGAYYLHLRAELIPCMFKRNFRIYKSLGDWAWEEDSMLENHNEKY